MRWSPKPLDIGDEDGFEKTDLFGYKGFGTELAKLIGSFEDDPVLVLDGAWGSGKTTFSRQWAGLLRGQGHFVAHFDAFAADHYQDPFLPLVGELHCLATECGLEPESRILCQFREVATAVVTELGVLAADSVLPGVGRLVAQGAEVMAGREGGQLGVWIKQAADRKRALQDFRRLLQRMAAELVGEGRQEETEAAEQGVQIRRRLIVIVDELDRCRPLFALNLLERIKHVFGVQGVSFVLVANLTELGKSVRKVYGDVDDMRYLEKFFDIVAKLPEEDLQGYNLKADRYVRYLLEELQFPRRGHFEGNYREGLTELAASENLSLRVLEHVMRQARILVHANMGRYAAFLPVLRATEPFIFEKLCRGQTFSDEERDVLVDLWSRSGHRAEAGIVVSELTPACELARCARLLAQFRGDF